MSMAVQIHLVSQIYRILQVSSAWRTLSRKQADYLSGLWPASECTMSDHFKAPQRALSGVFNVKKFVDSHFRKQEKVNTYFQSQSSYWKDVYASNDVQGEIFRDRHAAALAWIDSLALAPGSQVLEIGCGAGFMAVALAQRGFRVQAIDSAEAMVELARRHAAESGTTD